MRWFGAKNGMVNENSIAGYRTVRSLNETTHSQSILVRAGSNDVSDESTGLRIVKRFVPHTPMGPILGEIECRLRARGAHVLAIDDVAASHDDTPVLVMPWQSVGTLRRLMRERDSLRAGEAITILAPLSAALTRVHRAGVAMGSITVDAVHFDSSGRPFFAEWQQARAFDVLPTPLELQEVTAFQEDRSQFALLASGVLSMIAPDRDSERLVAELVRWLADPRHIATDDWALQCESQLFALGAPEPVRLSLDPAVEGSPSPPHPREYFVAEVAGGDGIASEWGVVLALPAAIQDRIGVLIKATTRSTLRLVRVIQDWCRPVRKRTWVVAGAGLLSVALATAVLASDGAGERFDSAVTDEVDGERRQSGKEAYTISGKEISPDGTSGDIDSVPVQDESTAGEHLSNDPLAALLILLETRERCIRDLSIVCLEVVAAPDSPAFAADSAYIQRVLAGDEPSTGTMFDPSTAEQLQRLGDSVLLGFGDEGLSEPASLLLVKGEAGWRIRSYTLP